jgi:flagellar hook-basal body complex protein FliE
MAINTTAESLLAQVRAYQDQLAAARPSVDGREQSAEIKGPSFSQQFSEAMVDTLREVSDVQQSATSLSEAYQAGEDVPLTDVVVAMQKSSLAFETTLQVRNKVLQAYQDIMNMPV